MYVRTCETIACPTPRVLLSMTDGVSDTLCLCVAGLPGVAGPKGDKGAASDPLLVAQNLGSMDHLRGPPGPKGK